MGPWYDCSGRLLINAVPVEKKTPLPNLYIMEKLKDRLSEADDEPWLKSILNGTILYSDRSELEEKENKEFMNTNCMCTTAIDCKSRTVPEVKLIQRRGHCTIVKWQDGTETKVVLEEGKPDTGIFGAYCIALAKKCAGSTEKLLRTIDEHDERAMKCRHLALIQELREKQLKRAAEERKIKWENDVAAAMYDSRVRDEAIKRLWAKEEKEDI